MSPEHPDFPSALVEMRHRLSLSQEDLARELGVSFVTVNRWEKGHSKPSKLAMTQVTAFSAKMLEKGKLP
jgi:putative transcriptional regulator